MLMAWEHKNLKTDINTYSARVNHILFNERGLRTLFLSGDDSQEKRESAIERLEQDDYEGGLDYIFSVDIVNEGIDAPRVNQVIMLRPTQSPVIFMIPIERSGSCKMAYEGTTG